ncbi:MAG TPA: PAS domain-containing protein [Chloroflexi bacterium]|nr:PAS domain-containing protein [Chloroflexota bacterium]
MDDDMCTSLPITTSPSGHLEPLSLQDQMQILYEIAISIGVTLDTGVMFTTAIDAFLRQLNGAAGAIYFARQQTPPRTPISAIPRNARHNEAIALVDALLPRELDRNTWEAFITALPQQGQTETGAFYHLLPLGNLGLLALVKHDQAIDPDLLRMLTPLLIKLTEAGRACLQNEELAAAYHSILWERNMLRTLIDATPSVLFSLDQEGKFLLSEGRGLDKLGRKPGQAVGQSVFELYADNAAVQENIRAALAGETRIVTVETQGRAYDAIYRPVIDQQGQIHGVVGAAYDVTERKTAIDTLTAVLNTVDEGIITTDAEGRILMANTQTSEMFACRNEELIGKPLWMLLSPPHRPDASIQDMQQFVAAKQLQTPGFFLDLEGQSCTGRTFPIEMRIQSFVLADRRTYTVSIRDVTERREYDRLRDDFVSTVSHELRTPLASIMGWTETLLTEHPGPLTDLQKRFLNTVYASSVRLDKLIEEILTVSRIQRGTLRLNPTRFNPSQLLANALNDLAPQANARTIRLVVEDHWPADELLDGDVERLEQSMKQLLANAIKFSPQGGEVLVRSERREGAWRFEVEDHGMGVEADEIPLIFQRFYRGKAARKAQVQGAGLGLYVCKAVAEGHGGDVTLTSEPGVKTVAHLHIPLRSQSS